MSITSSLSKNIIKVIIISIGFIGCSASSFTYKAAKKLDLEKIQFYLKLRGDKIPLTGGPVYLRITNSTERKELIEESEGIGVYKETKTKLIQEDAIRIPLGTPGILHEEDGIKKLYIDFGEGVILLFETEGSKDDSYYSLRTRKIEIDGKEYYYDEGAGGWSLGNYVLNADVDIHLFDEEIREKNEREIQGKTLKDKK